MKVVAGCPIAERAWALPDWVHSLRSQVFDGRIEIVCLYTHSHDATLQTLRNLDVDVIESALPSRAFDRMVNHHWSYVDHEYEYMASLRNELRENVISRQADFFLSMDSDIYFHRKDDLSTLLATLADHEAHAIAPLVNMDSIATNPPAWNFMSLLDTGAGGDRLPYIETGDVIEVGVIMAAMLLDRRAQMVPWRNHPQGEDIGWSLKAHASNLKLLVDPNVRCTHRMNQYV